MIQVPNSPVGRTEPSGRGLDYFSPRVGSGAFGAGLDQSIARLGASVKTVFDDLEAQKKATGRFTALSQLEEFNQRVNTGLVELRRNYDPTSGENFVEKADTFYKKEADGFLATVPDDLREEFGFRVEQMQTGFIGESFKFNYDAHDTYFREGINNTFSAAKTALDQDSSLKNQQLQMARVWEQIDASDLSELEKRKLRTDIAIGLEMVAYKSEVRRGGAGLADLGVGEGDDLGMTMNFIANFEGFRGEAYWDVNHNRVGFGSDTVTNPDGTFRATRPGEKVSMEGAKRDLQRRVNETQKAAAQKVGVTTWGRLPARTKAALTSVAYNYGEIPDRLLPAIQSGDNTAIADAIASLGPDNGGVNNNRRAREAALVLGDEPPQPFVDLDPRFADIPYEDRLALRRDAETEAAAEASAAAKAAKQVYDTGLNTLLLNINDGKAGQADIDAWRDAQGGAVDYDDLRKTQDLYDKKNAEAIRAAETARMYSDPTFIWNPSSEDHRKRANEFIEMDKVMSGDGAYISNAVLPFIDRTNMMPTELIGTLTAMTQNTDPVKQNYAFDLLSQLEVVSPEAYATAVPDQLERNVMFWQSMKDYLPADEVVRRINGGTTIGERQETERLREEGAKSLLLDPTASTAGGKIRIRDAVSRVAQGADQYALGWAAAGLERDLQTFYLDAYPLYRNPQKAMEAAEKMAKSRWGAAQVGGMNTLMRLPPEKVGYQKINGSYDWISDQVLSDLSLPPGTKFQLLADDFTQSEFERSQLGVGTLPSYQVIYFDNGMPRLSIDYNTGLPHRVRFEVGQKETRLQEIDFGKKQAQQLLRDISEKYQSAKTYEALTGVPIPEELQTQYDNIINQLQTGVPLSAPSEF